MKYLVGAAGMVLGGVVVAGGAPVIGGAILLATVIAMVVWPSGK